MPKKLDLTDNLEKYIIDHSETLSDVQNEIIQHNKSLRRSAKITNIYITSSISTNINKSFKCKKNFRDW